MQISKRSTQSSQRIAKFTEKGFTQNKVLVLLDGIPLADAYNSKLNLSSIPLESIAKITVTKGPASSIYGPNAMGGVISIVTKKFAEKPSGSLIPSNQYISREQIVFFGALKAKGKK